MEGKRQSIEIKLSDKERDYYEYVFSNVATNEPDAKVVPDLVRYFLKTIGCNKRKR